MDFKVARCFPSVDSTNAAMIRAMNAGAVLVEGAVFTTDRQSAGRGQGDNRWHATPAENLTLSAFLQPDHLSVDGLFRLTEVAALAVAATVATHLPPASAAAVRVKWPNDVYVGARKIAGILIQNGLRGTRLGWSVVGIGLNVNEGDFPPELVGRATSLRQLAGRPFDRADVLRTLLDELGRHYPATTTAAGRARLAAAYHERLYGQNRPVTFRDLATGRSFTATVLGVSPDGRLRVDHGGHERYFALREVAWESVP